MKISIIVPVYNEKEHIEDFIGSLLAVTGSDNREYEVIAVDDGSTDGTAEKLAKLPVEVVTHPYNLGYGAALKSGMRRATGELICIIDADGTYKPEDIPRLAGELGGYEMVVGARTGSAASIPLIRRPAKWLLRRIANYLMGVRIPDLNSGLRIFKRRQALRFIQILPDSFSFTTTITLSFLSKSLPVKFVEIEYLPRKGSSKIRLVNDGFNFLILIVRTVTLFRPLKVFLPLSFLFFASSLAVLFGSMMYLDRIMDNTVVLLFVSSVQIGVLGFLAEMIAQGIAKPYPSEIK